MSDSGAPWLLRQQETELSQLLADAGVVGGATPLEAMRSLAARLDTHRSECAEVERLTNGLGDRLAAEFVGLDRLHVADDVAERAVRSVYSRVARSSAVDARATQILAEALALTARVEWSDDLPSASSEQSGAGQTDLEQAHLVPETP